MTIFSGNWQRKKRSVVRFLSPGAAQSSHTYPPTFNLTPKEGTVSSQGPIRKPLRTRTELLDGASLRLFGPQVHSVRNGAGMQPPRTNPCRRMTLRCQKAGQDRAFSSAVCRGPAPLQTQTKLSACHNPEVPSPHMCKADLLSSSGCHLAHLCFQKSPWIVNWPTGNLAFKNIHSLSSWKFQRNRSVLGESLPLTLSLQPDPLPGDNGMTGSHAYDYWHHLPPQKGSFLMSERCSFFPPTPRKRPPYVFPAVWKTPGLCWVPTLISWELPGHLSAWHGFRIHQAQETGCTEVHLQRLVAETFKSSFLFFPPNIDRALYLCRQTYYRREKPWASHALPSQGLTPGAH